SCVCLFSTDYLCHYPLLYPPLFPYTTLFRSCLIEQAREGEAGASTILAPVECSVEGTRAQRLGFQERLGTGIVVFSQHPAVHLRAVEGTSVEVQILLPGVGGTLLEARILRPLLGVDVVSHVPGFLVTQLARLAQRHVVLDEGRCGIDPGHARTPVVGAIAP